MTIRQTSYLRKSLMPGEKALLEARLHWIHYMGTWCAGIISCALLVVALWIPLCLIGLPISGLWAFISWMRTRSTQFLVTNKRIIFKEGIISIHTEEIRNAKVESIEITQPIMGRILGYATIHFAGTGNSDVYFCDVANPWRVKSAAEAIVNGDYEA